MEVKGWRFKKENLNNCFDGGNKQHKRSFSLIIQLSLYYEMMTSDIQGRIEAALALKPGEGESS